MLFIQCFSSKGCGASPLPELCRKCPQRLRCQVHENNQNEKKTSISYILEVVNI